MAVRSPANQLSKSLQVASFRLNQGGLDRLTRGRQSPVVADLERRALNVTRRMKQNASGRPGPNIRSKNLYDAIGFLRAGADARGDYVDIGPQGHRMIRRGYNYALILEGIFPRGGAPPDGTYRFLERSLEAARD